MGEEVRARRGWYRLMCGSTDCPTRLRGELHEVHEDELPDGEVWYCLACRSKEEDEVPDGEVWHCPVCRSKEKADA